MQNNSLISLTENINFDIGPIDPAFSDLPLESIIPTVKDVDIQIISEADLFNFPQGGSSQDDILPMIDAEESIDGLFSDISLEFQPTDYTESYVLDNNNFPDDQSEEMKSDDDEDKNERFTRRQSARIQDKTRRTLAQRIRQENQRLGNQASNPSPSPVSESTNYNLKRSNSRSAHKECRIPSEDSSLRINHCSNNSKPSSVTSTESPGLPNLIELTNLETELPDLCDDFEDDDPSKLWCICRQPHGYRFMICCDQCDEWFHGDCVGISEEMGADMSEFTCPPCSRVQNILVETFDKQSSLCDLSATFIRKEQSSSSPQPNHTVTKSAEISPQVMDESSKPKFELSKENDKKIKAPPIAIQNSTHSSSTPPIKNRKRGLRTKRARRVVLSDVQKKNDDCLASNCKSKINPHESLYCSDSCIQNYVDELIKLTNAIKRRRLNENKANDSMIMQQFVMLERRTGNVLSGKKAPREDNLLPFLKKYPTYEVIKNVDVPQPEVTQQSAEKPTNDQNENNRKKVLDPVRLKMRQLLGQAFAKRIKNAGNVFPSNRELTRLIIGIEEAICSQYEGRIDLQYQARARLLITHLKDARNEGLFRRVLSQEIPAAKLVQMTSEQLSSPEVIKPPEAPKQTITQTPAQSGKPMPLATADTTSMHGKHFFDINCKICTGKKRTSELEDKEKEVSSKKPRLSTPSNSSTDAKPSVAHSIPSLANNNHSVPPSRIPLPPAKSQPSSSSQSTQINQIPLPNEKSNLRVLTDSAPSKRTLAKMSAVSSNVTDQPPTPSSLSQPSFGTGNLPPPAPPIITQSSSSTDSRSNNIDNNPKSMSANVDIDCHILVQAPSNLINLTGDGRSSHDTSSKKLLPLWRGELHLKETGSVNCKAFIVSCTTQTAGKTSVSPSEHFRKDRLHLVGRSDMKVVLKYLKTMKEKTSKDVTVIRFHPTTDSDKESYLNLYNYLHSRERCGVAGNRLTHVKDFFIFPLNAHNEPPKILKPFKGPGLEDRRPHLLLGIIVWDVKLKQQHSMESPEYDDAASSLPPTYARKAKEKPPSSCPSAAVNKKPREPSPTPVNPISKPEEPRFFLGSLGLPLPPPADDEDDNSPVETAPPLLESTRMEVSPKSGDPVVTVDPSEKSRLDRVSFPTNSELSNDTSIVESRKPFNDEEIDYLQRNDATPVQDKNLIFESLLRKVAIPFLDDEADFMPQRSPSPESVASSCQQEEENLSAIDLEPPIVFGYVASRAYIELYIPSREGDPGKEGIPNFVLDWNHTETPSLTFIRNSPPPSSVHEESPPVNIGKRVCKPSVSIDYAHSAKNFPENNHQYDNAKGSSFVKNRGNHSISAFKRDDNSVSVENESCRESDTDSSSNKLQSNVTSDLSNHENRNKLSASDRHHSRSPVTTKSILRSNQTHPTDDDSCELQENQSDKIDQYLDDEYSSDEEEIDDNAEEDSCQLNEVNNASETQPPDQMSEDFDSEKIEDESADAISSHKTPDIQSNDDIQTLVTAYSSSDEEEEKKEIVEQTPPRSLTSNNHSQDSKFHDIHSSKAKLHDSVNQEGHRDSSISTSISKPLFPSVSRSSSKLINRYKICEPPPVNTSNLTSPIKSKENLFAAYSNHSSSSLTAGNNSIKSTSQMVDSLKSDELTGSHLFAAYAPESTLPDKTDDSPPVQLDIKEVESSRTIFPAYLSTERDNKDKVEKISSNKIVPPPQSGPISLLNNSIEKPIFPIQIDSNSLDDQVKSNLSKISSADQFSKSSSPVMDSSFTASDDIGRDSNKRSSFNHSRFHYTAVPLLDKPSDLEDIDDCYYGRKKFFDLPEADSSIRGILKKSEPYSASASIKRGILKRPVHRNSQSPLSSLVSEEKEKPNELKQITENEKSELVSKEKHQMEPDAAMKAETIPNTDVKPKVDSFSHELNSFYHEIKKVEEEDSEQKESCKFISTMTAEEDIPSLPAPPMPSMRILSFLNDDNETLNTDRDAYDPESYDPGQWLPDDDQHDMDIAYSPDQDVDDW